MTHPEWHMFLFEVFGALELGRKMPNSVYFTDVREIILLLR